MGRTDPKTERVFSSKFRTIMLHWAINGQVRIGGEGVIGDRVRRLLDLRGWSIREAAEHTGLAAGTLGDLVSPGRKSKSVNQKTLTAIAEGFGVPAEFLTTSKPPIYARGFLAALSPSRKQDLSNTALHVRAAWLLSVMQEEFGDAFAAGPVAERLDLSTEDLVSQLDGQVPMQPGLIQALAVLTGAGDWLLSPSTAIPENIKSEYDRVSWKAYVNRVKPHTLDAYVDFLVDAKAQQKPDG